MSLRMPVESWLTIRCASPWARLCIARALLPLLLGIRRPHTRPGLCKPGIRTGKGVGVTMAREGEFATGLRKQVREVLSRYRETGGLPEVDLVQLLGDLDLYCVEMERQSEDLRRTLKELDFKRGVIRCSTSAIAACNLEGTMMYGNPFFQQKWGFDSPEEFLGKPFWRYWSVQDRLDEIMQGLRTDGYWFGEIKAIRKDGSTFDVQVSAAAVLDRRGRPVALTSTSIDTTERRQMEQALRESESRLRLAVNTAGLTIWDWDVDRDTIVWDNPHRTLVDHESKRHGAYEWWVSRIHPEDREAVLSSFNDSIGGGADSMTVEYRFLRPDETWADVRDHCHITRGEAGQVRRVIGAMMDVTDLRRAERKLRQVCDQLERRVEERTVELKNRAAQLARLSSELTLAEQRERKRMAGILHDHLQQLLVAAIMKCEVLSGDIGAEHAASVDYIRELVVQAMETSRSLTAELAPPALHRGNLSAALVWLAGWMRDSHGLTVELSAAPGLDPGREDITVLLFQSIREMLLNVVKHASVKTATVAMDLDRKTSELRVMVLDRGSGFDPSVIRQGAPTGTGFGLFSIRERLALLGGSLRVESSPGRGASFTIVVPLDLPGQDKDRELAENKPV